MGERQSPSPEPKTCNGLDKGVAVGVLETNPFLLDELVPELKTT